MGKILISDFVSQKKNIIWILLIAILAAVVGFGFQAIYFCTGILLTAGACIIYFSCFFDYQASEAAIKSSNSPEDDRIARISRKKLQVRTKYVEIIFIAIVLYILMSIAFFADAFDRNLFADPDFDIAEKFEQITLFPLVLLLLTSVCTPVIFKKRISKAGFISLAFVSIILSYGVFLLDFFTGFMDNRQIMVILPFPVIGLAIISYFISMTIVIREK